MTAIAGSGGRPEPSSAETSAPHQHPGNDVLIRGYFQHVAPADQPSDARAAGEMAARHRELGQTRPAGTALIASHQPPAGADGWGGTSTVLDIVNDDMPHLVTTVLGALAACGVTAHRLFHPIMAARRGADGGLLSLAAADTADAAADDGIVHESWMHLLIDRITDDGRLAQIRAAVATALAEIRSVTGDTDAMTTAAHEVAAVAGDGDDAAEIAALLQWMTAGNATFIGYRAERTDGDHAAADGSALGVLRQATAPLVDQLIGEIPAVNRAGGMSIAQLWLPMALARRAPTLSLAVQPAREAGLLHRFLVQLTPQAVSSDIKTIPVLRRIVSRVLSDLGATLASHTGQEAVTIVAGYPRSELFWAGHDQIMQVVSDQVHIADQHQLRVFLQEDPRGHFMSALVYVPRDRHTTTNRLAMQKILLDAFGGHEIRYTARVGDSLLAAVHFTVMTDPAARREVDLADLTDRLRTAIRTWEDQLSLLSADSELSGAEAQARYAAAFDESYKEDYPATMAVTDLARLESLTDADDLAIGIDEPTDGDAGEHRLKVYVLGAEVTLSRAMPVLQSLGVDVIDERPYDVTLGDGRAAHIYDFGIEVPDMPRAPGTNTDRTTDRFSDAFLALWRGAAEIDGFNTLVLASGLTWREVAILRGYAKYLQQLGIAYTQRYIEQVLCTHPVATQHLVGLFEERFDPARPDADRQQRYDALAKELSGELDAVVSLDADRILRSYLHLIAATDRTNAYRRRADGTLVETIAFKLVPARIPGSPKPVPAHEIWVYSPRVEGTHLRFGAVARGGLRWSSRPEDFRTEVLGLVKAQEVKNAVIVPVGAKGGFVVKRPPTATGDAAADRDALAAEGVACYTAFISAMLEVTDNRVDGAVVPPVNVVRHDGDDPYLVVAADKGTARFSDIANGVAKDYGFWLGDAFASGGSAGYDHKGMGITARGAWESVKHHFRELGVDCQTTDFTCVGIGDMSGDVFGNGMRRSRHTRLVAAFDHRDIFVDPDPDAAAGFTERERLYHLPRSSWADYNRDLISAGGGVWSRSLKSIPISPQMRAALGLAEDVVELAPTELIKAILCAPVDLVYNGGIGTYIKSSAETHAEVGDKANDAVRVDGADLRAKIVGEGGNLGVTQRGRIEFARAGGRINTDAIDNSGGVDASDHEVNIKIGFAPLLAEGAITEADRNELLGEMTDDVAHLVLADNVAQNRLLGVSRLSSPALMQVYGRQIDAMTAAGLLDRDIEFLPDPEEIEARVAAGQGLCSPELAVMIAYTKTTLATEMLASKLPEDPAFARRLPEYFPAAMRERAPRAVDEHPLAREIVTTMTANEVVNRAGITYAFRLGEEIAASATDAIRAYTIVTEVFDLDTLTAAIDAADHDVPAVCQDHLTLLCRRLLDRAARWFLSNRPQPLNVTEEIARYSAPVHRLLPLIPELLCGVERGNVRADIDRLVGDGATPDLAERVAHILYSFSALDIADAADASGRDLMEVARLYFALSAHLGLDHLLTQVSNLGRGERWHALARQAVRDDFYQSITLITADVLSTTEVGADADVKIARWEQQNASRLERARATLGQIAQAGAGDLAALSVAAREMRAMIR